MNTLDAAVKFELPKRHNPLHWCMHGKDRAPIESGLNWNFFNEDWMRFIEVFKKSAATAWDDDFERQISYRAFADVKGETLLVTKVVFHPSESIGRRIHKEYHLVSYGELPEDVKQDIWGDTVPVPISVFPVSDELNDVQPFPNTHLGKEEILESWENGMKGIVYPGLYRPIPVPQEFMEMEAHDGDAFRIEVPRELYSGEQYLACVGDGPRIRRFEVKGVQIYDENDEIFAVFVVPLPVEAAL